MRILLDEIRVVVVFKDMRQPQCLRELAMQSGYRVGEMSLLLGCSRRYVQEVFSRDLGVAPKRWLRMERMSVVEQFFAEGLRPGEVAERLGFSAGTGFRKEFRQHYGMPPREFMKQRCRSGICDNQSSCLLASLSPPSKVAITAMPL